ncbi:calcium-binding and coiled-coil domain-containing protein 1 [Clupea harengus]|uniref:Calcium-binding and coiled-coil domain-containing protein 1 n=1 Tax=Clupea harengus TaxID=7950 RepID=A0A6P3WFB2_CLUHA|nr:calcium-binding and coiled-coil domain-containing protein 1 [Clupea harengus]
METAWKVEFRNVGSGYFPESRIECHYTISSQHIWASNDWIGLFKVGWASVKDYHTFVWALAPAGYKEGSDVNCCVHFQASYLPKPNDHAYQFVYVDSKGEVGSRSTPFTFGAPKPLEDLVTLEEGGQEDGAGEDMLMVIPRAELLQSRLQECLKERGELLQALEAADRIREREKDRSGRVKESWERVRRQLERDLADLKEELGQSQEEVEEMKRKQEEVLASEEALAEEKSALLSKRAASEQRIRELEDDIKALSQRALERETEMERMKEKAKKVAAQRKEEENEQKSLQVKLEQTEAELRSLSAEFQGLRSSLAQRDTHALQLRDTICTLTHKLNTAHRKEAESEAALGELRSLQERLRASERAAEDLRGELSALAVKRDQNQAELHQARLQAAQLTLQLADSSLALREGRACWAQERESLQRTAEMDRTRMEKLLEQVQRREEMLQEERMEREKVEVELGREKDCNRVQLSETRRELQELKASLRVAQKEKEQLQMEKQDVLDYARQLEQRLQAASDYNWGEMALLHSSIRPESPMSDSEDEKPEALQPVRSSRPLAPYGLCEQPQPEPLLPATPPPSPRTLSREVAVVISQPAPLSSPRPPASDTLAHSSESEEDCEAPQSGGNSSGEETALLLFDHIDPALSDLTDATMW